MAESPLISDPAKVGIDTSGGASPTAAAVPLRTAVFLGSTRDGRHAWRVGQFVKRLLEEQYGHQVDLIDPLELQFPMLKMPLHFYPDKTQVPSWLVEINGRIKAADAFVVVSAEYNYSIPPALSNMLDHFPMSTFAFKPTGIAVYSMGNIGGLRVVPQLQSLLSALQSISVPEFFSIPIVQEALDPEGIPVGDGLVSRAKRMTDQLDWYARATRAQRLASGYPPLCWP